MTLRFEPISLDRQEDYLSILAQCPQIASDYSFLNLWGWSEEYGLSWAWNEDMVWIRQSRPEEYLWAPVGLWDAVDWPSRMKAISQMDLTFTRVPDMLANLWRERLKQKIQTEEERGNWDYLYRVADLIELKGKRYHKKKNLVNQFNRKYDFSYLPFGADMVEQAYTFNIREGEIRLRCSWQPARRPRPSCRTQSPPRTATRPPRTR